MLSSNDIFCCSFWSASSFFDSVSLLFFCNSLQYCLVALYHHEWAGIWRVSHSPSITMMQNQSENINMNNIYHISNNIYHISYDSCYFNQMSLNVNFPRQGTLSGHPKEIDLRETCIRLNHGASIKFGITYILPFHSPFFQQDVLAFFFCTKKSFSSLPITHCKI